jgi:hypothetical protein
MDATVLCLEVFQGDLIAGGLFITAGGITVNRIALWNGTRWYAMGQGMNGQVNTLEVHHGILLAGGTFTSYGGRDSYPPGPGQAQWDGTQWTAFATWEKFTGSIPGCCGDACCIHPTAILHFSSLSLNPLNETSTLFMISIWGGHCCWIWYPHWTQVAFWTGTAWTAIMFDNTTDTAAAALTIFRNNVVVGGSFTTADGFPTNNIAQWANESWLALGNGLNGGVGALITFNEQMVTGGSFTSASDVPASHIAIWDGATRVWSALGSGMNSKVRSLTVFTSNVTALPTTAAPTTAAPTTASPTTVPASVCANGGFLDGGLCTCPAGTGWSGVVCSVCSDGWYGANCNYRCADCAMHGSCTPGVGGFCTCNNGTGWSGASCNVCPGGWFGVACNYTCAECAVHGTCVSQAGCTCAPGTGWSGETCSVCSDGWYGANCNYRCADCEVHGTCTPGVGGYCTCNDGTGWSGATCSVCPAGWFGAACNYTCAECAAMRGSCTSGTTGACMGGGGKMGFLCAMGVKMGLERALRRCHTLHHKRPYSVKNLHRSSTFRLRALIIAIVTVAPSRC